jgi:MoxR-like ATPase
MDVTEAHSVCDEVLSRIEGVVIGERAFFERILVGVLARGHVLLEDVPGTGKTLTARSFAQALGLSFTRIQFTPDLLPSDITGVDVYRQDEQRFEFQRGPVFANVVLADEINRAPPKTQAALLEAMEEGQVSVDGETYALPDPFFVIATQNPIEQEGTFRLPEAQVDRFVVKTTMGYPERTGELDLLDRREERAAQSPTVEAVVDEETVRDLQSVVETVTVRQPIKEYVIDLARATRQDEGVDTGVSPRGIQRLYEAARARAVIRGRDYVVPDDIKRLAPPVYGHRVVLTTDAKVRGVTKASVIERILDRLEVPDDPPEATGGAA